MKRQTSNTISDISALAELTKLQSLYLNGNELNSGAYAIHIPALEGKGISLQYDEHKPWDVTSDGMVNIFDLVVVAHEFGKSSVGNTAADVNGDGIVNIFDLILLPAHFAEQYGPAAAPIVANRTHTQPDVELRMVDEE